MNTSLPNSALPTISSSTTTTGLASLAETPQQHRHHITKVRDTNKLTSESSSLNFKQPASYTHLIRSHTREFFSSNQINSNFFFSYVKN